MKTIYIKQIALAAFFLISGAVSSQENLTTQQWQEDLRFLQEKVHVDYPFLFDKITAEDFDAEVGKLYAAMPEMEAHEAMIGLLRTVSLFKYGHTDMGFNGGVIGYHKLPLNLYEFSDGMYIEGIHQMYEKALGAKVIAVEGMPLAEVLKAVKPTVPVENDQYYKAFGINNIGIPEILHAQGITKELKQEITFTLEKDGQQFDYAIKAMDSEAVPRHAYNRVKQEGEWLSVRNQEETPLYLKHLDKNFFYEYLADEKTLYVRHSKVRDDVDESIHDFFGRVFDFVDTNEVEKLVIDVRLNGGGNNYLNKPIIQGIIETKKINQKGKLFVIIGRRTFSACQNLINEIDNYTNVTFVGEPSAENINFYGDTRKVVLPNSKFPVYLSFAWWQDKPQWENASWTVPHILVEPTFEEYRTNQDPVLDTVLAATTDAAAIVKPMDKLTELFVAGKFAEVQSEAARMVKDPAYKHYDFEKEFGGAGIRLLENGNAQAGVFILDMVVKLFPDSAAAWVNMGYAQQKTQQIDKAKESLAKAISLDPKGSTGDQARKMLAKIGPN